VARTADVASCWPGVALRSGRLATNSKMKQGRQGEKTWIWRLSGQGSEGIFRARMQADHTALRAKRAGHSAAPQSAKALPWPLDADIMSVA
jgi:hypothetical protein